MRRDRRYWRLFWLSEAYLQLSLNEVCSRDRSDQRADVLKGNLSTALVHLANISYRLGTQTKVDRVKEEIFDRGSEAVETFEHFKSHLKANGVD